MWLGLAAWRLGDYAEARREGETSLAMKRHLGMDGELSRSFNALGLLAWNEGRHADALQHFDSAIAAATRHHDTAGIARAAANVPLVLVELGDFDGARRGLDTALAAGRAANDDRLQGNALANLAMLEIRLGSPRRAIPLLARARARYAAIEYATGEGANALGQLATAWSEMGDLQRALALADSALEIARVEGLQQEVASELEVIADLHEKAGESLARAPTTVRCRQPGCGAWVNGGTRRKSASTLSAPSRDGRGEYIGCSRSTSARGPLGIRGQQRGSVRPPSTCTVVLPHRQRAGRASAGRYCQS